MRRLTTSAVLLLAGCIGTGTEIGNPPQSPSLGLTAFSSDGAVVSLPPAAQGLRARQGLQKKKGGGEGGEGGAGGAGTGGAGGGTADGVEVVTALVSIKDFKLVPASDCTEAGEIEVELGGKVVDVAAGATVSELDVPLTAYCETRLRLDEPEDANADPRIGRNSVVVTGFTGDQVAFEIRSRERFEFDLRGGTGSGFVLDEKRSAILVAFDVKLWFADVDLSTAIATGGVLLVDESHNPDLLAAFEAAVQASAGVYRDGNRDGVLERDEVEKQAEDD